jgi:hypothetical protein
MEEYRKGKGKGDAKGAGKGPWESYGKGGYGGYGGYGGKAGKGHGKKGAYWFDQPADANGGWQEQAWAFSVGETAAPPGLPPPILTSKTWAAFEDEADMWPETPKKGGTLFAQDGGVKACPCSENAFQIHGSFGATAARKKMPKGHFSSKTQLRKKAKDDDDVLNKAIQENEKVTPVLCLTTTTPKGEAVNMVQGWRREEQGWVRVRSVMDSGCGVSVAPPGMCPAYPIEESEGSRRGQEFMSASENTMPNLGEQKLEVVLDGGKETAIKYQIADVSRALNAVTEICDAGHPDFGNHVIFGRRGGMIVNLETGKMTHFQREGNIYCLDYWVKPFARQEL